MKRSTPIIAALAAILLVAACTGGGSPAPTPGPTPSPGVALTVAELKLALIEELGALWYCDPDFYPVPRGDEAEAAIERWPEVVADTEAFEAIVVTFDLDPGNDFTDTQKVDVYRAWKVLNAIALDPIGNATFRFDYLAQPKAGAAEGTRTSGTISLDGDVNVEQQAAAGEPMCPICLARGTGIDTPTGRLAVERLSIGDPVWTLDRNGTRVHGEVIAMGSTSAPAGHRVVRLVLADGRSVTASPGHPIGDGRALDDLRAGDAVDGSVVASAILQAYAGDRTFDIVVSGATGLYLVDGIPMGSTLRP